MNEFLDKVRQKGDLLGLVSVKGLFKTLGNPQNLLPCIQVVGTNGKGSTCAFLSSILSEAGYRVGVYTSPEVYSYYERFSVNGTHITKSRFEEVLSEVKSAYEKLEDNNSPLPTIFEVETACAVLFFVEEKCDVIIMEAGMGGDLDATNVFESPIMAVFTSIGIDHIEFLGDNEKEIANHKAGIIKQGEAVVSAPQTDVVKQVLENKCRKTGSKIVYGDCENIQGINLGLGGDYQKTNAATAYSAAAVLNEIGYDISYDAIKKGLENAYWPGRFEKNTVCGKQVIVDGAHNVPAALALISSLKKEYPNEKITLILGMLRDKDCKGVLEIVLPLCDSLFTVTPDSPRAKDAKALADLAKSITDIEVISFDDYKKAALSALSKESRIVVVAGTFTILRDFKSILEKIRG